MRHLSRTSTTFKVELSVTLINKFQPLTNIKKNSIFLRSGGPRYPYRDTVKLEKTPKNPGNVLAKIEKKSIFSEMNLAGSLMKKHA